MAQEHTPTHTPTPWSVMPRETTIRTGDMYAADGFTSYVDGIDIFGPDERPIVGPHGIPALDIDEANAELIVTAVNSYASSQAEIARLREALDLVIAAIGDWSRPTGANGMVAADDCHPLVAASFRARAIAAQDGA